MPAFKTPDTTHDPELVRRCLAGEPKAQKELYDSFSRPMFGVCLRFAKHHEEAWDMMQEGSIRVFNNLDKYRNDGFLQGWIRRIFINSCIGYLRRKNSLTSLSDGIAETVEDTELNGFDNMALDDLLQMVQELPDGYRSVFNLFVVEGYTHKEISDMLGINEGTSKSQLFRAKKMLKEKLTQTGVTA